MSSTSAIARLILASGLPYPIKCLAVALGLYGNRNGRNIYPSVGRLAHELGITQRSVQRQLGELITIGVLLPVTPRTGGRGRTTVYELDLEALPDREPYQPRHRRQGLETAKGDTRVTVTGKGDIAGGKPRHLRHERVTAEAQNRDIGVTRSGRRSGRGSRSRGAGRSRGQRRGFERGTSDTGARQRNLGAIPAPT